MTRAAANGVLRDGGPRRSEVSEEEGFLFLVEKARKADFQERKAYTWTITETILSD